MKREWEPGDVAMTIAHRPEAENRRALRVGAHWIDTNGAHWADNEVLARPLVVIDPEDREQVERLVKALSTGQPLIGLDPTNREMVDQAWVTHTQTALREFANPTPLKPEEPMGLGAVVATEADGDYIRVRIGPGNPWLQLNPWLNVRTGAHYQWDRVAAVRVLSEGVTA